MEYAEAGPIMRGDHSINKIPLAEGVALKFFRDVLQVGHALLTFFRQTYRRMSVQIRCKCMVIAVITQVFLHAHAFSHD